MSSDATHPVAAIVREWSDAWNACDAKRLAGLAGPGFRFRGPNGELADVAGLEELVAKQTYGVALKVTPLRLFGRGERYVVALRTELRYVEEDELAGATDDSAMTFEVRDGAVTRVEPSATLAEALASAGLGESDRIADLV